MRQRRCSRCKEEKAETLEFFGMCGRWWDSYCRVCRREATREYGKKNKEKLKAKAQRKLNKPKTICRPCVICGEDRGTNHARCDACVSRSRPLPGTKRYNGQVGVLVQGGI